jgi:hypothetical protein
MYKIIIEGSFFNLNLLKLLKIGIITSGPPILLPPNGPILHFSLHKLLKVNDRLRILPRNTINNGRILNSRIALIITVNKSQPSVGALNYLLLILG